MENTISTYQGRPCSVSEMTVGNTVFTVISVQSDHARETAYQKLKRLILDNAASPRGLSESSRAS
ncbi:MAG: transposon-encoded TnpW family protein [Oscillospiraceae bacterium]|nr:transposon-encoded TnpW family protein [Oscillospiraceae bacterium]